MHHDSPAHLQNESAQYKALALSRRVWEDHVKQQGIEPYRPVQAELHHTINEIDTLKRHLLGQDAQGFKAASRGTIVEYANQSMALEANPLKIQDALMIKEKLNCQLLNYMRHLRKITIKTLASNNLPASENLLPGKNASQVAEVMNHIFASRYLVDVGLSNPGTAGISAEEIQHLARITLVGTDPEKLNTHE